MVGLYYCIEKCENWEVAGYLKKELFVALRNKEEVELISVWDKNVDYGSEISNFFNDIISELTHHTDIGRGECRVEENSCHFIECELHKAYCWGVFSCSHLIR
uniref:Uncharacterized protein n=1 Tax=Metallosphaera hakonensis JCM 8857 = DSM 7519 TaxID=1293036 RepID=A0A2U9IWM5_9CREN